jgi:glycine betaine/proline transport system permease protein
VDPQRAFALFTVLAFALIESMRLWDATMSSLSLVLVASSWRWRSVCRWASPPPATRGQQRGPAGARPHADHARVRLPDPRHRLLRARQVPGVVATVVFAMPPAVRLTELGIRQVDAEVVEAGHAFGAAPTKILTRIQLPLALPTIMAGINQVIMLALSMVVIAGMVGAGGIGAVVFRGITRLDVGLGVEGGLAVVILAIFLDRTTAAIGDRASRVPRQGGRLSHLTPNRRETTCAPTDECH